MDCHQNVHDSVILLWSVWARFHKWCNHDCFLWRTVFSVIALRYAIPAVFFWQFQWLSRLEKKIWMHSDASSMFWVGFGRKWGTSTIAARQGGSIGFLTTPYPSRGTPWSTPTPPDRYWPTSLRGSNFRWTSRGDYLDLSGPPVNQECRFAMSVDLWRF